MKIKKYKPNGKRLSYRYIYQPYCTHTEEELKSYLPCDGSIISIKRRE